MSMFSTELSSFEGVMAKNVISEWFAPGQFALHSGVGTERKVTLKSSRLRTTRYQLAQCRAGKTYELSPEDVRFGVLAEKWKSETVLMSSTEDIVMNDSYQRILAMGPGVLPHIFAELRRERDDPSYWFWALEHLTQVDPVPDSARGRAKEMRRHWLEWADKNGFAA